MTVIFPPDADAGDDAPGADTNPADEVLGADAPADPAPVAPVAPVAPYTGTDGVTLFIAAPYWATSLVSGVDGWEPITQDGTVGPAASIANVIAAGESSGITIESR